MATPRQPSPRTLSPDVPVVSYPTPNTGDLLVVQDMDTRLAGYTAANYGDPHPDSATYPNLKLVYQTPLDNESNFMWVRRVYANERFNQEAYNYALKYSGEDPTKPIYVRTYTLPRADYAPVAKGTPDPVNSGAVLVEEAVDRIKDDQTDGQLDSLFLKVTRVYETLPGPGLTTKKKGSANSIPAKFQAARQVTVTKTTVDAATEPDDTTSTIVESSVEQASIAKAQKINSVLDTSIVSLVSEKITPQQQVATQTETMVPTGSGQDVVVADALTLEGTVDNLGNGQSIVTRVQAPSVFSENEFSAERPDVLPAKFRVAVPTTTTSDVEAGTAAAPTLSTGDLFKTEEQVTVFKKRKKTTSRTAANSVTLRGKKLTPQQQLGDVTETYDPTGAQTVTPSALVVEANIEALGDGSTVLTETTVDEVFAENRLSAERPDVLPAKFRVAVPTTTTSDVEAGTAAAPTLSTGDLFKTEEQVTVFKKRKKTTSRTAANSVTLRGKKLTPQQQLGDVTETYDPTGAQTVTPSALVVEANIEALGDGSTVLTETAVGSVFPETHLSKEKPLWGIPMKFKVADPPLKTSHVVEGTVSDSDVALSQADMDATAEQVTEFKKKVSKSSMSGNDIGLVGTQTGTWGVETVTESLRGYVENATGGYGVKEQSIEPLGDGRAVEKKVEYPPSPAELVEYHMDETYKILIKMTKRLVNIQGYSAADPGRNAVVELHAIDAWNAIEIISEIFNGSLPEPETWEHTVHFSFYDELIEAGVYYEKQADGKASSGGVNVSAVGSTKGWRAEAQAQAKAIVRAVPYTKIKAGYSGPCRASTTRSYSLSPPTGVETVTRQEPVIGAIVITGTGGSYEVGGFVSGEGQEWTQSGGSTGSSLDVVAVRHSIGPVVHNSVTLTEHGTSTATDTASATSGSVPSGTYPAVTATASASVTSTLLLPASTTPIASGDSLISEVRVEKWRFGVWIKEVTTVYRP